MRPGNARRTAVAIGILVNCFATAPLRGAAAPAWVARSNEHAKVLLDVTARFNPEFAGRTGVEGLDAEVLDLKPQLFERQQKAQKDALAELKKRDAAEADPLVKRDLAILIEAARQAIDGGELNRKLLIPYANVPQIVISNPNVMPVSSGVPFAGATSSLVKSRSSV